MDAILGKPSHYGIVVGDIYAQVGIRTNPVETVTVKCGFQMKESTRLSNIKKVINNEYYV